MKATTKFRYAWFRKLVTVFGSFLLIFAFYAWRTDKVNDLIYHLLFFLVGGVLVFLLLYGGYIFERFRVDNAGVTVKRPFRSNLRYDFKNIGRIDVKKSDGQDDTPRAMNLHTRDGNEHLIKLSDLKYGSLLKDCIEAGMARSQRSPEGFLSQTEKREERDQGHQL